MRKERKPKSQVLLAEVKLLFGRLNAMKRDCFFSVAFYVYFLHPISLIVAIMQQQKYIRKMRQLLLIFENIPNNIVRKLLILTQHRF